MKKLLITGASGFLGWHLCQLAQSQLDSETNQLWQVYGLYHTHASELSNVTWLPLDLTDFAAMQQLVRTVKPDAIIHAAALSSPNACQSQPQLSYQINVEAAANLAELSAELQIPCVFTSSEQVFDGLNPPYRETDPVCPINLYGEHKATAEAAMQERYPDVTICRMPLMFGAAPVDSFVQPWIRAWRNSQTVNLFTDEIRNPVSATDAAAGLFLALERVKGILHLGGRQRLSRYQLGSLLAEMLDLPGELLIPCRQVDVQMAAPRPPDVSLDSSLAFSLGYQPDKVQTALAKLRSRL